MHEEGSKDEQPVKDPTLALSSFNTSTSLLAPQFESKEDQDLTKAARAVSIDQIPLIDTYCAKSRVNNKDVFIKIFRDFKSKPKELKDCIM